MRSISLTRTFVIATAMTVAISAGVSAREKNKAEQFGVVVAAAPEFNKLVPQESKLEKLASGFDWSEGPVWSKTGGYLLFSDVPQNKVFKWQDGNEVSIFLQPSGYTGRVSRGGEPGSNGLVFDPEGRLVLCQHGDRRVARLNSDGTQTTIADRYDGKRFNSPNDAVYKSNGDLYFTDPPYGLPKGANDPARELDFCGVYRVSKTGEVTLLTKEMTRPNGIAFSPDEKTLYVAQSDPQRPIWMAFPVENDGTIGSGRVFFDATPWVKAGKKGLPDGMKVDHSGNVFATGPGGVQVFSPEGKHLGTIETGEATANCNWGNDGSMLYITADMHLCRIPTTTKGLGF